MEKNKIEQIDPASCSLSELCGLVKNYMFPFEDVAEFIEDKIYSDSSNGESIAAVDELKLLTDFFELMPDKNEENCRDLADVYILIGELYQYTLKFKESIDWFKKAAIVSDRYAVPYHNLAVSYGELGDKINAIKCLEQEIALEPGNYFSILQLVDFYEQENAFDKAEECLKKILERNPDNVKALHKLILYYESRNPELDVELMRRRLIAIKKDFNEIEIVIRTYHLCREKRFDDAVAFLTGRINADPQASMLQLLKAHVCGEMHQFSKKKKTLIEFKKNCMGKTRFMENKLEEFGHVFGKKAVASLEKILMITHPS
jgi:tetratricopeptide (TPR) repeat protein